MVEPGYPWADRDRHEVEALLPRRINRLLDVGCGQGAFGELVKRHRPETEVWGVEPHPDAVAVARARLDNVVAGRFPDDLDAPPGHFDCIVFNDVLEHMVDPWAVVAATPRWLASGGVAIASIPNVRQIDVLSDLVVRGKWRYTDMGILDRTHLRFFTRESVFSLFSDNGFDVIAISPINTDMVQGRAGRLLARLGHRFDDLVALQFVITAKPRGSFT